MSAKPLASMAALAEQPRQNSDTAAESEQRGFLRFVPSLYSVATIVVIGAIFITALAPHVDTDFYWHIKVGQYIATHHLVPSKDFMTFSFAGHAWTDHEWLAELGMYGLYQLAGLWGPITLFAFIITVAFGLSLAAMRMRGVHPLLALFVLVPAFTASRGSWGPRVQMLTLMFAAAYMLAMYLYVTTEDRRLLLVFPAIMLIWANVHAGFAIGLAVLGMALIGEAMNRVTGRPQAMQAEGIKWLGFALLATFAVTMVNPNGVRQLLYPLTFLTPNAYTNLIEESASPNFHQFVMTIFEGLLLLLVVSIMVARPKLNWTEVFYIIAFTHLALSQVRNVPLWCVVVTPLLATYLQQMGPVLREMLPLPAYRRRPVRGRLAPLLNLTLLLLAAVLYVAEGHSFITQRALARSLRTDFPTGGVAYLKSHHLGSRVFTSYAWGGYFLWNLYPQYRDFMDSRADTVFNTRILDDYLTLHGGSPGWKKLLRQYRVQTVLVEPDAGLIQPLSLDRSWKRVYRDSMSVVYVLRS